MIKKIISWLIPIGLVIGTILFFLHFQLAIIISGSMEPAIMTGEMVIIDKTIDEYKVGDVISYSEGQDSIPITHRIVSYNKDGDYFTTKGDANKISDSFRVTINAIVGKVVYHSPLLGILYVRYKYLIIFTITGIVGASYIVSINNKKKKKKMIPKEEE